MTAGQGSSDREDIQQLVMDFLAEQERSGQHAGGSGHVSQIEVSLDSIEIHSLESSEARRRVECVFTRTTVTEFTYFPDNPPMEDTYKQVIYVDKAGTIIGFEKKRLVSTNFDFVSPPEGEEDTAE